MRFRTLVSALGATILLLAEVACDCRAAVTPVSTAVQNVRVSVAGPGGLCGTAVGVGSIEVYRGPSRDFLWHATFHGDRYPVLTEIGYGSTPKGFVEEKKPEPLKPGDEIYFQVHGPGFRGETRIVVTP